MRELELSSEDEAEKIVELTKEEIQLEISSEEEPQKDLFHDMDFIQISNEEMSKVFHVSLYEPINNLYFHKVEVKQKA